MTTEINNKLKVFFSQFAHKHLNKGEILIYSGTIPSSVFYLEKGYVKQYTINEKGTEIVLNIFKPYAYFPMSNAVNNTRSEYYFEADSEIDVWVAPVEKVIKFIQKNPEVLYDLLQRVFKGTDGLFQRMNYLMSGRAYFRLIIELLIQAKRFGEKIENDVYKIVFTEGDLAAYSGLTRETVSREMRVLKEKGLVIREQKHFIIPNIIKLEQELSD